MSSSSSLATRCATCDNRSTWEFLGDFFSRVEAANGYAQRLECDLHEVWSSHIASQDMLDQERQNHQASQEALSLERKSHQETLELLQRILNEAIRSGTIADILGNKLAELQAATSVGTISTTTLVERQISPAQQHPVTEQVTRVENATMSSSNDRSLPRCHPIPSTGWRPGGKARRAKPKSTTTEDKA